jgi:hypothetical protein
MKALNRSQAPKTETSQSGMSHSSQSNFLRSVDHSKELPEVVNPKQDTGDMQTANLTAVLILRKGGLGTCVPSHERGNVDDGECYTGTTW